jgi:hypothetical protein
MRITQDVRDYAAALEIEEGLKAKAAEFRESGGEIYVKT